MKPTRESFLHDVRNHEMTVEAEDGVNRRLYFGKPGSFNAHFRIVTFKGHLVYTGDMGTYVFSRIEDMFEFFRFDGSGDRYRINPGYWAEKVLSVDKHGAIEAFDFEKCRASVAETAKEFAADLDSDSMREAFADELQEQVLDRIGDDERDAHDVLARFEFAGKNPFQDAWEWNFRDYTFRYLWCCHAIVWAIEQFDAFNGFQNGDTK